MQQLDNPSQSTGGPNLISHGEGYYTPLQNNVYASMSPLSLTSTSISKATPTCEIQSPNIPSSNRGATMTTTEDGSHVPPVANSHQLAPSTGLPAVLPPNTIFILPVQQTTSQNHLYPKWHAIGLGITQIVCGVLSVVLGIICIFIQTYLAPVGHGIWCGAVSVIAGCFGISAGKYKSTCLMITYLVMSIINSIVVSGQIVTASFDVAIEKENSRCIYNDVISEDDYYYSSCETNVPSLELAVTSILLITGVVQTLAAIWAASLTCRFRCCSCCRSCCCICYDNGEQKLHPQLQVTGTQQLIQAPQMIFYNPRNMPQGYQYLEASTLLQQGYQQTEAGTFPQNGYQQSEAGNFPSNGYQQSDAGNLFPPSYDECLISSK